jgi:hypothetical protein
MKPRLIQYPVEEITFVGIDPYSSLVQKLVGLFLCVYGLLKAQGSRLFHSRP